MAQRSRSRDRSEDPLDEVLASFKGSDPEARNFDLRDQEGRLAYRKQIAVTRSRRSVWTRSPSPPRAENAKGKMEKKTARSESSSSSSDRSSDSSSESESESSDSEDRRKAKKRAKKLKKEKKEKKKAKKSKKNREKSVKVEFKGKEKVASDHSSDSEDETVMARRLLETIHAKVDETALQNFLKQRKEDTTKGGADVGPSIPVEMNPYELKFTGHMKGEGAAMSNFVKAGQRIPRRGEVGWSAEQIEDFENIGYVMSGSRHKRMNAVRIRKENQIYSAEEKLALVQLNFEEKQLKEKKLLADLRKYIDKDENPAT